MWFQSAAGRVPHAVRHLRGQLDQAVSRIRTLEAQLRSGRSPREAEVNGSEDWHPVSENGGRVDICVYVAVSQRSRGKHHRAYADAPTCFQTLGILAVAQKILLGKMSAFIFFTSELALRSELKLLLKRKRLAFFTTKKQGRYDVSTEPFKGSLSLTRGHGSVHYLYTVISALDHGSQQLHVAQFD